MQTNRQRFIRLLRCGEILYLLLITLSFYLLFSSRTGEARTVWEVLHPFFLPVLLVSASLLVALLLTSEKVAYKLVFIIVLSVLIHSFFSIIFPAGDLSGQQIALGRIVRIYNETILHGWLPHPAETVQSQVYTWLNGINFQAAITIIFARMFNLDLLCVHLFLVPVLWGIFTPIATYLTTYFLTRDERIAVVASLLINVFPYASYFGAISVPNSLGFIFFFYSIYFMQKVLDSTDLRNIFLVLVFSFFAFLLHDLTGIMSLSLLLLIMALKSHRSEESSISARFSLMVSFIVSASILPLSLIYLRFFRPITQTVFTLDRFYESSAGEIVGLFFLGELAYSSDLQITFAVIVGPALAFLSMICLLLYHAKRDSQAGARTHLYFSFLACLIMLIDYRILKLFMSGLPLNEERLWVFRDFIAAPYAALAIYAVISSLRSSLKVNFPSTKIASLKGLSKSRALNVLCLLLALNILIPLLLGGWITFSLKAAYPQVAPLQTTWYELEAVRAIEDNTPEKYVVIGDMWTIFAGETIVGINNPQAYYFTEQNKTGYDLFVNMKQDPSPQWMLTAMNYTNATIAYFIISEPRLGTYEFNSVVSRALQNQQLVMAGDFGDGKLYVFSYRKNEA